MSVDHNNLVDSSHKQFCNNPIGSLHSNKNILFNRLILKNVPLNVTKDQIMKRFFDDLQDIHIHFPKIKSKGNERLYRKETRLAFVQFCTNNEGKLARKIVNSSNFLNIEADFALEAENRISSKTNNQIQSNDKGPYDENSNLISSLQVCSYCGLFECEFICSECSTAYYSTYYCSEDHQARDWLRHRAICKIMPPLKRITKDQLFDDTFTGENPLAETKPKFFIPHSDKTKPTIGDKVFITAVARNLRVIHVRKNSKECEDHMNEIKNLSESASYLMEKPEIFNYCLAPCGGVYYRARVQDVFDADSHGFNVLVYLVDIGSEIKTQWQLLKHMGFKLRGMCTHTFKFVLENVKISTNEQINEYLQSLIVNRQLCEVLNTSSSAIGDSRIILKDLSTGKVINQYINELICGATLRSLDQDQKVFYDFKKNPKLPVGKDTTIRIMDNSKFEKEKILACMSKENFSKYLDMALAIKQYAKTLNERYTPMINEVCLVKHQLSWYRAAVHSTFHDKIRVTLLDSMEIVEVSSDNIGKIPCLLAEEFFTSLCYVEGVTKENMERARKLLVPGFMTANVDYCNVTDCIILTFPEIQ